MTGNWALLAFQIFGFIILLYLMHHMYDRLRRDAQRSEARAEGPEAAHLRAGVGDLVRELRQAAEEINADMASRASTLQKLVDEANGALKRLDAAAQRANGAARPARPARPVAPRAAADGKTSAGEGTLSARERDVVRAAGDPVPEGAGMGGVTAGKVSGVSEVSRNEMESALSRRARPASQVSGRVAGQTAARPVTAVAGDGPWPGAPSGAPAVQVPPAAAGSPAAASAYRQAAAGRVPSGPVSVDLADPGRFQAVRRLADQGFSTTEIARTIGLGREEVELIMRVGEAAS